MGIWHSIKNKIKLIIWKYPNDLEIWEKRAAGGMAIIMDRCMRTVDGQMREHIETLDHGKLQPFPYDCAISQAKGNVKYITYSPDSKNFFPVRINVDGTYNVVNQDQKDYLAGEFRAAAELFEEKGFLQKYLWAVVLLLGTGAILVIMMWLIADKLGAAVMSNAQLTQYLVEHIGQTVNNTTHAVSNSTIPW